MIYEILGEGSENKKSRSELIKALDIEARDFHDILRKERRDGNIIISTKEKGGGYWLWNGDYSELERYYKMQRSGAIDILVTLKPIQKILKKHKEEGVENE